VLVRPLLVDREVEPSGLAESSASNFRKFPFSSFCTFFFGLDLLSQILVLPLMVSFRGHRNDTDGQQRGGTFMHLH
jgi:hypothetical protein